MISNKKCIICGSERQRFIFGKESGSGDVFNLVMCSGCGLMFLEEVPDEKEIEKYYTGIYFSKRTDRGYNNYFSGDVRDEIERVFKLNLEDLGFFDFEKSLNEKKRSLDIGCAAGYFVNYLKERGWESKGIDISRDCVQFAVDNRLNVEFGNYLEFNFSQKFDLITLWATIEHLHHPELVLEKAYADLKKGGMLYISTCRVGGINFMNLFGSSWRFFNFPEHIYFFSYRTLKTLLNKSGFTISGYKTYGSNVGVSGSFLRKFADYSAKKFYMGDMMIVAAEKI
ncbi:MAG: class I SAM-dependent methyltransferase [Spirochaetes bacterium]|nr:class I SAM-dependent methyltransferase [Spirochaetota bacterium]